MSSLQSQTHLSMRTLLYLTEKARRPVCLPLVASMANGKGHNASDLRRQEGETPAQKASITPKPVRAPIKKARGGVLLEVAVRVPSDWLVNKRTEKTSQRARATTMSNLFSGQLRMRIRRAACFQASSTMQMRWSGLFSG